MRGRGYNPRISSVDLICIMCMYVLRVPPLHVVTKKKPKNNGVDKCRYIGASAYHTKFIMLYTKG